MKAFFQKLKILHKNPKSRALLEIGLYLFFFLTLFIILNIKSSHKVYETVEQQYETLSNFPYTMVVYKENQIYHIIGNKNEFLVEEQDQSYQIINTNILDKDNHLVSTFDWYLFFPHKLSSFIKNGIINAKTQYKDGSQKIEYEMECQRWNPTQEGMCYFETLQKENKITQVILKVAQSYSIEIHYQKHTLEQ